VYTFIPSAWVVSVGARNRVIAIRSEESGFEEIAALVGMYSFRGELRSTSREITECQILWWAP
jgi:hypothetical protein